MSGAGEPFLLRAAEAADAPGIIALGERVYPAAVPWSVAQLAAHREVFPEGQLVALERGSGRVVAFAASLVVLWDDYAMGASWRDFTAGGTFRNHDPAHGRTLYGAEVMTCPEHRGRGLGKRLYAARRELVHALGLLRIRAGARLRGYHLHAPHMSAEAYVQRVVRGELSDPTLSFQLRQGFAVLAVVPSYLPRDPESLGYAAVIEWLDPARARPSDYAGRDPRFASPSPATPPRR